MCADGKSSHPIFVQKSCSISPSIQRVSLKQVPFFPPPVLLTFFYLLFYRKPVIRFGEQVGYYLFYSKHVHLTNILFFLERGDSILPTL